MIAETSPRVRIGPLLVTPLPGASKYVRVAASLAARNSGVGTQEINVSEPPMALYSRLEKKFALALTIGPPKLYPVWFRRNRPFSIPLASLSGVLLASFSFRKN